MSVSISWVRILQDLVIWLRARSEAAVYQAGHLVQKAEVNVEVHVGEIVLVAELQSRDFHRGL